MRENMDRSFNGTSFGNVFIKVIVITLVVGFVGGAGYFTYNKLKPKTLTTNDKNITTSSNIGDVNGDGKITKADADLIDKYYSGKSTLTASQKEKADTDSDGVITDNDAKVIRKYVNGVLTQLPVKYGDVNGDNSVDNKDVKLIQNYLAGKTKFTTEQKEKADVDLDGSVDSIDATYVQRYIDRITKVLPIVE